MIDTPLVSALQYSKSLEQWALTRGLQQTRPQDDLYKMMIYDKIKKHYNKLKQFFKKKKTYFYPSTTVFVFEKKIVKTCKTGINEDLICDRFNE